MRKGRDGEKKKKREKKREKREKTDENSYHYVIANSRPPERWLLERRTLLPIVKSSRIDHFKCLIIWKKLWGVIGEG